MTHAPFVLALLGVACTALAGGGASDVRYSVTPIAHSTSSVSLQVEDLNNKGEVVGVIRVPQPRAFYWRRVALTPDGYRAVLWQRPYIDVTVLQTLPGELDTRPLDVNERGQVIGYTIVDGFSRGFLWETAPQ